jgi:hypothetical protein
VNFWDVSIYCGIGLIVIFAGFATAGLMGYSRLLELKMAAAIQLYAAALLVWLVREDYFSFWPALAHVIGAVLLDTSILAALVIGFSFVQERIGEKL